MNALQDKNSPDTTEQTSVNPFIQSFTVEEDPEFQLHELMREHTNKLTDLHKVSLDRARDDARTVFDAAFKAHKADIDEAVKAAASSEEVINRLNVFHEAATEIFKRFDDVNAHVNRAVQIFKGSSRRAYWIHGSMLIASGGMTVVVLLIYIALGVRLA